MIKNLRDLLSGIHFKEHDLAKILPNLPVTHITYDSRLVQPGGMFVAIRGYNMDGHAFISDAADRGASVVVVDRPEAKVPEGIVRVPVTDSRQALPDLAAAFYDYPSRRLKVIGITGTNGKTTTAFLSEAIFKAAGYKTGLIGTIENHVGEQVLSVDRTTPESADIEHLFWQMTNNNVSHVAMEVSSHALDLGRVKNIEFDVGVFTNLTQDHLDFHGTLENYLQAKAKLFHQLGEKEQAEDGDAPVAVLNADDLGSRVLRQAAGKARVLTYGITNTADVMATDTQIKVQGAGFTLRTPAGNRQVNLNTTGLFSIYNALAACSVGLSQGIDLDVIVRALENIPGVPGRFEQVRCGQDFAVIVDYAHTPDGLENILKTAREFTSGRVILLFGCGGDRDRTKRPIMGRLAVQYADKVIITSDNPRTEDPDLILQDVEAGVKESANVRGSYTVISDRRLAIHAALEQGRKGDVVLIAGKGHETYQILGTKTIHFDDREIVRDYFEELRKS